MSIRKFALSAVLGFCALFSVGAYSADSVITASTKAELNTALAALTTETAVSVTFVPSPDQRPQENDGLWVALVTTENSPSLTTPAGAGFTGGAGTVYENSVQEIGSGIILTTIMVDLTGLASSTTDLDIIGVGASAAHLGRITAAQNGTVLMVRVTCLELPAGGADDIDLYAADEATGVFDAGVATLAETALITAGGAWANGTVKGATVVPAANQYLYLTGGEAGTAATYTAGKFLIEIYGYDA